MTDHDTITLTCGEYEDLIDARDHALAMRDIEGGAMEPFDRCRSRRVPGGHYTSGILAAAQRFGAGVARGAGGDRAVLVGSGGNRPQALEGRDMRQAGEGAQDQD
jgi:hypothetical protein